MMKSEPDFSKPLPPGLAKKKVSMILARGSVVWSRHAREEMRDDEVGETDVVKALRDGQVFEPPEFERTSWRYRCHTERLVVVIAFRSSTELVVVTVWRKRRSRL